MVEILPHQPFYTMVANASEVPVHFSKNMKMETLEMLRRKMFLYQCKYQSTPASPVPISKQDKEQKIEQHLRETKADEKVQEDDRKNQ